MNTQIRWQAIVNREQTTEPFFYGVLTTGIFCRPDCPSKQPNRENVIFFNSINEAKGAGFRPCKRCSPELSSKSELRIRQIIQSCRRMDESTERLSLETLAKSVGLSTYHFQREFKKYLGVTPLQYARNKRAGLFERLLRDNKQITEAIYDSGYESTTNAYQEDSLAMAPKTYRAGGLGVTIKFSIQNSKFGYVVIGVTERGVCAIQFADTEKLAEQSLRARFPKADIHQAEKELQDLLNATVAYIETPNNAYNLPLDIQGTAFQQQVWQLLRTIRPGDTMTYSEVAEKLGKPTAFRAVASACANNKHAVVIPCHRVVGKSGKLTGYRWGLARKKALLKNEKEN